MAALRWDEKAQAFVESTNVPMRYDAESGAWVETTGMAWDEESQAWTERWNTGVKAYVYGAALETVTIKKDGIIVATVDTDSTGQSAEQITLSSGTYTITGSVSGWTEEQTVDGDTTKFRAMPEGALYWYGNECTEITGGYAVNDVMSSGYNVSGKAIKETNAFYIECDGYHDSSFRTINKIDLKEYSKIYVTFTYVYNGCFVRIHSSYSSSSIVGIIGNLCANSSGTYNIDITDIIDENYVVACCGNGRAGRISSIWLEK